MSPPIPEGEPRAAAVARRRRIAGVVAAIAATVVIWAVAIRDEGSGADGAGSSGDISEQVRELAEGLSPEALADQVLLLGFDGADAASPVFATLAERQLGGVLVDARNWIDAGQGAALIAEMRAAGLAGGRIPPLVAVAQEGGPYRALPDLPPAERALDVGDGASTARAEEWAGEGARALRGVGFDLDLFPVADVATLDSPIADRAFSDDAAIAAEMTAAAVRACRSAALACAALHFPGLGAASQDTGQGPATVSLDAAALEERDLAAFRAAFAERVPAAVLSLAFYAAYDPVTPAALSEDVATGLLRDELDYGGVAITDDLGAGAVTASYSVPQAAVMALRAGSDLIQIASPADQDGVREAILAALRSGELPEARLREAAGRVLELKRSLGLLRRAL